MTSKYWDTKKHILFYNISEIIWRWSDVLVMLASKAPITEAYRSVCDHLIGKNACIVQPVGKPLVGVASVKLITMLYQIPSFDCFH